MSQTVRIDRDAFKRGVQDAMTFAPLRNAVKIASGVFTHSSEKPGETQNNKEGTSAKGGDVTSRDGKSSRR